MMMSVLQKVKGLMKKLYFVILLVGRPVPMQNFRLNVFTVYLFWHRYSLHYNVLLEMMMSVLQEVKRLTKKLYFIKLLVGRPVPIQNFRLNVYTVYLFWHRYSLHYNVLSRLIIISFSRSKEVNGKIICLCTSSDENLFTCKISSSLELCLVRFMFSKEDEEEEEEDEESVKIMFTCISYLVWHFHLIFFMQLLFYMFFTLMSLKDRLRLKLKVKTQISLCMAIMLDNPWQSLYTVLCDISLRALHIPYISKCFYALLFHRHLSTFHGTHL